MQPRRPTVETCSFAILSFFEGLWAKPKGNDRGVVQTFAPSKPGEHAPGTEASPPLTPPGPETGAHDGLGLVRDEQNRVRLARHGRPSQSAAPRGPGSRS